MTAQQTCFDFKPITMQREVITHDWFKEAMTLLKMHWQECAMWHDKIQLSPDEEKYLTLERLGLLLLYTMRQGPDMVGYMIVTMAPHMHYKEDVFGHVDVLFLDPTFRRGLAAIKFMKWVESEVKKLGASVMTYHIKVFHDYPAIFERMGYQRIETIYGKCLKES